MTHQPAEPTFADNLLHRVFDLWIDPEVERRQSLGLLPEDFRLRAAQVILNVGAAPEVRLDEEVRAKAKIKPARPIEAGDIVRAVDVDEYVAVELTDVDPDAGHVTVLRHQDGWSITFDFRYNAARVALVLDASREFLACAQFALAAGHERAATDNLFSAVELMAKADLLKLHDTGLLSSVKHSYVAHQFNRLGHTGTIEVGYLRLLNRLRDLRTPARYPPSSHKAAREELQQLLAIALEMHAVVAPRRVL